MESEKKSPQPNAEPPSKGDSPSSDELHAIRDMSQMSVEPTVNGSSSRMSVEQSVSSGSPQMKEDSSPPTIINLSASSISLHDGGSPRELKMRGGTLVPNTVGEPRNGSSLLNNAATPQQPLGLLRMERNGKPRISKNFCEVNYPTRAMYKQVADEAPTLYHLNNSQSQRVLWLMEEMEIPYILVAYERDLDFRAPKSFMDCGTEYGKAPFLITATVQGGRGIPESSAIISYLIRTYDYEDRFGLKGGDLVRNDVLCSVYNSLCRVVGNMLGLQLGHLNNGPNAPNFCQDILHEPLRHLSRELGDWQFFMGRHPGCADILIEWPMSLIYQQGWLNLLKEYPNLYSWLKTVYSRPAWRRSIHQGNGYDLKIFPDYRGKAKEAMHAETIRAEPMHAEAIRAKEMRFEAIRNEVMHAKAIRAEEMRSEAIRSEAIHAEATRTKAVHAVQVPPVAKLTANSRSGNDHANRDRIQETRIEDDRPTKSPRTLLRRSPASSPIIRGPVGIANQNPMQGLSNPPSSGGLNMPRPRGLRSRSHLNSGFTAAHFVDR